MMIDSIWLLPTAVVFCVIGMRIGRNVEVRSWEPLFDRMFALMEKYSGLYDSLQQQMSCVVTALRRLSGSTDEEVKGAGLPLPGRNVGDKAEMLKNCERFIDRRCGEGGSCQSYAELEAENARLKYELTKLKNDWGLLDFLKETR